jgi:hypothetical protein
MAPQVNVSQFADAMTPGGGTRPITWVGWYGESKGFEAFVEGLGIVRKIREDEEQVGDDSYAYDQTYRRSMIFELVDCGPSRWFEVAATSSSYGYSEEAWFDPHVREVTPEEMTVTRWKPVV